MKVLIIISISILFSTTLFSQRNITINISGLESNKGQVVVVLYKKGQEFANFEKYYKKQITKLITEKKATVVIENIPEGEYSFVVFHDENSDGELEKAWYGMPKEGIANSGNHTKRPNYDNTKFTITGMALRRLGQLGIDFVVMSRRGEPIARLYPLIINKTVETRIAQYKAMINGKGFKAVTRIVESKVRNQSAVLKYFAKSRRMPFLKEEAYYLDNLADEILREQNNLTPDDLREIEAHAARRYWSSIATYLIPDRYGFTGRKHEGTDPFNMLLNYGYGILYSIVEKALLLVGLDPYGGFFHIPKSGKPTLTFDFIEQFRPVAVDKPLIANLEKIKIEVVNGFLSYETRKQIAEIILSNMKTPHYYEKRKIPLESIIVREASKLAKYLRGTIPEYKGYHAWW